MRSSFFVRARFLFGLLIITILGIVVVATYYIAVDRSFDVCVIIPPKTTTRDWTSNVKIGIIGDSWVSGQKLDQAIRDSFVASGVSATVISSGNPGAKSRQIYRDMLAEKTTPFSSNHILMDENLDYLVVIAGVNDTGGHIGCDFYTHHILCIIKTAQARGIYPIIVEVPEYGIENVPANGLLSYTKRLIYKIIFDGMQQNVIKTYRESLRQHLTKETIGSVSIVSFSSIVDDYSEHTELYANPSHLNKDGCQKLGYAIGTNIIAIHNSRTQKCDEKVQSSK